jgi:2-dehydro-3-deoxyglucarate aldolase/4-hydroxy-2-oxoheptanedioate aldolase
VTAIRSLPNAHGVLRDRLRSGVPQVGTFAGLGAPGAVEVCAVAGADWVLLDLEHGAGTEAAVRDGVLAAEAYGVPALVRVESLDRLRIGRCLDLGAAGVMVPRVDSAAQAAELVRYLNYPPEGDRGVAGYNRQGGFGLRPEVLRQRNGQLAGIVQIETRGGLDAVADIAAVPGVDVLFIGPVDLSYALGAPLNFGSAAFQGALDAVLKAAHDNGITAGIMAGTAEIAAAHVRRGFGFVSVASDASVLAAALHAAFTHAKSEDPE